MKPAILRTWNAANDYASGPGRWLTTNPEAWVLEDCWWFTGHELASLLLDGLRCEDLP